MISQPKNIILVDDHEIILLGLKTYIEDKTSCKVISAAKSINAAKEVLKKQLPDLIIIDVDLGKDNGFDFALWIKENYPQLKIIMYSMHEENYYVLKTQQLGLNGYISKASDSNEFVKCIDAVFSGKDYIEDRLFQNQQKVDEALLLLTKREQAVFKEMLKGGTNEDIAAILKITKHSVEVYATTIYEKTFCQNRTDFLKKFK